MKPKLINKIYLAGPLEGRTVKERFAWRDRAAKFLAPYGIECYIPGMDTTLNDADTIVRLDKMMIDNSEAILVNLTCLGEDKPTNTGTLIEIGYTFAKGKLIVGFSDTKWQRENRFLKGIVKPIFFINDSDIGGFQEPLLGALEYIAGFNNRRRNEDEI